MKNKIRIKCDCGTEITTNTWKTHLKKSNKCLINSERKAFLLSILELRTKNQRAWLKKDGEEAIGIDFWFLDVINGKTKLEEWTFFSPRTQGSPRPSTCKKMSKNRKQSGNPAVKSKKFNFTLDRSFCFY
jgi:hypothetical protein